MTNELFMNLKPEIRQTPPWILQILLPTYVGISTTTHTKIISYKIKINKMVLIVNYSLC